MSQPPNPSEHQPPPQQPQQGVPRQPSQQPGPYGYPPQGPPQGPYGYGYPQPPQPGTPGQYGQPQPQPLGQHGQFGAVAGYPPQPPPPFPYPPAQGAGPGRRPSGGKLAAVIVVAVVLIAALGGAVWRLSMGGATQPQAGGTHTGGGGGSPLPHRAQGKLVWSHPAPAVSKARIVAPTSGVWFTGADIVKQTPTGLTAYNLATGATHWTVPSPEGDTCDSASDADGGRVVVQYGGRCENVMAVDIAQGRILWKRQLTQTNPADTSAFTYTDMAVSGGVVAITWSETTASYRVSDGRPLWHSNPGDSCHDAGFAGGAQLVDVFRCGEDVNPPYHVSVIDPGTGKAKWTWDAPANTQVSAVLSTSPVVIGLSAGDDGVVTDIWDVDGGRSRGRISLNRGKNGSEYAVSCQTAVMSSCHDVLVNGDTLYLATNEHSGSQPGQMTNEIAAFDLSTGHPEWLTKDQDRPIDILTMQGASLLGYEGPAFDAGGKLVTISPAGQVSTYTTYANATAQQEYDAYGIGVAFGNIEESWHNETLVLSATELNSDHTAKDLISALH